MQYPCLDGELRDFVPGQRGFFTEHWPPAGSVFTFEILKTGQQSGMYMRLVNGRWTGIQNGVEMNSRERADFATGDSYWHAIIDESFSPIEAAPVTP